MGAGVRLQEERLRRGISLEEVEEETKIRKYYLQAIEQEDYQVLPPQVYATGFVKRYAKYLELDEQELVEEFKREAYHAERQQQQDILPPPEVPTGKKVVIPWRNLMAGVVFLVLALWIGNYVAGYLAERGVDDPEPQPPQVQQPAESPPDQTPEPQPQPGASQPEPAARLDIKTTQSCWVLIIVDGETQFSGTLPAGEEKTYQGKEKIYLKVGNAGGIDVTFNGQKQESLGAVGEVTDREYQAEQ